jgi:GntR family transcriptional regulator
VQNRNHPLAASPERRQTKNDNPFALLSPATKTSWKHKGGVSPKQRNRSLSSLDKRISRQTTLLALCVLFVIVRTVIPFSLVFEPGIALYEQVVYAAKKAVISGQMLPGDPFPSVRELSHALKINPNTAHKVILQLVAEGLIEVRSGRGTVVSERAPGTAAERGKLLKKEMEHLVVEAKKLGLSFDEVTESLSRHWRRLDESKSGRKS